MIAKPTNTLLRRFISIAITVGVVLVYAKPLPDNDQAGGYLIQQQPNAEEEFVVAYGGDNPEYNLDSPEKNTDPSFGGVSNPTPTIQENPTPANGEPVTFEWWDSIIDGIRQKIEGMSAQKAMEDKFRNFDCGGAKSVCCSGNSNNPGISGKHTCANSKFHNPPKKKKKVFFFLLFSFPPLFDFLIFWFFFLKKNNNNNNNLANEFGAKRRE